MKKLSLIIIFTLFPFASHAEDCTTKTCVNVFTENGQLVIEAHKNGQKKITTKVIPRPKPTVKPIAKPLVKPKVQPKVKRTYKPRPYTPRPRATATKVRAKSSPTLADRIIKSLPSTGIAFQPEGDSLIGVPTYFWSDLPTRFQTTIPILGENVGIDIVPVMTWHFGDGTTFVTTENGGPYPNGRIKHAYEKPGIYWVELVAIWRGFWTLNGVRRPIPGKIEQFAELEIQAVGAETMFVGK